MPRISILSMIAMLGFFSNEALAVTADCTIDPGAIPDTLTAGTKIEILGTCQEDVTVRTDDVTISGGAIDGSITVNGAQRFVVSGVSLSGPSSASPIGLNMVNGATAGIFGVDVSGFNTGIAVGRGSFAEMSNVVVTCTGGTGILITYGASADVSTPQVSDCEVGVDVRHGSSAQISNGVIHDNDTGMGVGIGGAIDGRENEIKDNLEAEVDVFQHGTYRGRFETIEGTPYSNPAVFADRLGHVDLRGSTILGDISTSLGSYFRLRDESIVTGNVTVDLQAKFDAIDGSQISGNIVVENQSIARLLSGATLGGDLRCHRASICLTE